MRKGLCCINRSPQAKTPWLSRALHCIGKAILADKAEAASRHYEQQQLQDGGLMGEGGNRRRSSAVRAVALFQKFKDYNEGGDGEPCLPRGGGGPAS